MMYISWCVRLFGRQEGKGGGSGAYCTFRSHPKSQKTLAGLDDDPSFEEHLVEAYLPARIETLARCLFSPLSALI